jgi:ADP-ribose pyrophosphatase YjhB (NUDIX family)
MLAPLRPGIDYTGVTVTFYCHDGKGNWLYHKRSKNCRDEQGAWDCGGGKLEFGEDLEEGVLREIKEEYGCEGTIQVQLPAISRVRGVNGTQTHWISIAFIVLVNPDDVSIAEPQAIDGLGWFKLDNLPQPLHTTIPIRLRTQKDYFLPYT